MGKPYASINVAQAKDYVTEDVYEILYESMGPLKYGSIEESDWFCRL